MACRLEGAKPLSEPMLYRVLLIRTLGTNSSEILSDIHVKMSSAKWWSFYLGLNVFKPRHDINSVVNGGTRVVIITILTSYSATSGD